MKSLIFFLLFSLPGLVHAQIFDMSEHSGIIKDSSGNYYKVNAQGTTSAIKTGASLAVTEKVNIPTSKGFFSVDLNRNVPVDLSRIGASVRTVAVASGPVGLTISAVSLVCELTSICDTAGEWLLNQIDFGGTSAGNYPTCQEAIGLSATENWPNCDNLKNAISGQVFWFRSPSAPPVNAGCTNHGGTAWTYTVFAYTCTNAPMVTSPVSDSDWNTAQPKLNDERFVQPFLDRGNPVPVGVPTITTPQKIPLGSGTTTTKDGSGNTTGTETTTTEAEISQPSAVENPTNSPSVIKITENNTVNNYNTSNQLTSSTSTVSSTATPVQQQQEPITITIDNVPDVPLQTVAVPGTFSFTSWGSGSCPSPKTWVTMFGTHEFSYQLTCDFAMTVKPIILLIAAIVSFMIVASIRTDT